MNKPPLIPWKIAAGLICASLIISAGLASAALNITTANQLGVANTWPFTPTFVVNTNASLIAGLTPTTALGNFDQENQAGDRDANSLTINTNLTLNKLGSPSTTTSSNYVTVGYNAGTSLIYTLPISANGYNLTNITVNGGWADNGRDALGFTVLYSTVTDPGTFYYLTTVNYNPSVAGSTASANQAIINDSLGGLIAANVAALKFDFTIPRVENGYTGLSAITVGGTPATSVVSPVISITTSNQSDPNIFLPTWPVESPSLIAGLEPATTNGNFTAESSAGVSILTDGALGSSGDVSGFATCGSSGGTTLIYTLPNVINGDDVTNVVVYSGWGNADRDGQYYTLSYSTVAAPATYIPITTVFYNPQGVVGASANRVSIVMNDGSPLGSGVANLKFDFASPSGASGFDNGYCGVSEIIVQGGDTTAPPPPPSPYLTQDTLPTHAETFVGDHVVFTAVYSNAPPANVQWLVITNGVTNTVPGATSATLTLNNVQTNDSGSYLLMAVNATNSAAAPSYSTAAALVVSAVKSVGNVVVQNSGQTGPSTFYPAWAIDTNLDLIFGSPTDGSGSPGTAAAGAGSYGNQTGLAGDPTILADGSLGNILASMVSCGWVNVGAGQSMTYTLPTQTYGYDITNITIYGGWPDDGRNEQKYQILYSTTSNPGTFVSIGTFDYNPSFTSGEPNANRVILVPAVGALAQNVYALEINFNMQSKNNWNGYSEITVNGNPSSGTIPALAQDITPLTAEDVVGSSLSLTAGFTGATSYQWQKNGVNISGATTTTLTLSNLQLTDTAANGGYRLLGINTAGTNFSRSCSVIIDPIPAATNNVVTAYAYQTSDAAAPNTFGPTWDTTDLGSSLIAYTYPSAYDGTGNFYDPDNNFPNSAGGLPVLTDGGYGVFAFDGSHPAFATCGSSAGQYVVYTLGSDANGYDVTNIQISGGWNDNGRNSQFYTVSYSTVQNPTLFTTLNAVSISPTFPSESVIRTTMTPATGVLASNVYAIEVNFLYPQGVPNGYSGYSEISVFGSASANPPPTGGPVITAQNELGAYDWTVEMPNLIANQLPSSYGSGVFTEEGCAEAGLTDGVLNFGGNTNSASCGDDGTAVPWVIFSPANGGGWDLTNIVVYSLWHDYGRDGQFYNLSYSTLSAPTTFVPLASVSYNPNVPTDGTASANRVAISPAPGQTLLASNVAAVKFDFTPQGTQDFGWSGYSEIVLQGSNLVPVNPPATPVLAAPYISDGNLILTGTGGTPNSAYTWLTTTNLTPPMIWETNLTGTLDSNGAFSNSIPVSTSTPEKFFRLRQP